MYYDCYKGIYFIEGHPAGRTIKPISTRLDGIWFSESQLKSLDDVKDAMIKAVKNAGGNAVIDFKYCQKTSFWRSLLSIDDVRWEASGTIAEIDPRVLS